MRALKTPDGVVQYPVAVALGRLPVAAGIDADNIAGLPLDDPSAYTDMVAELMR